MAHVQKREGKWQARYRDSTGREHAKRFTRKVDAERWLATTQADLARGTYVDPAAGKVTLADYAAQWTARMGPTWRVSTAASITNSLARHVLPVLGHRPVASLRRADVEALCASLALAPGTVATLHQHLGQLLGAAVEDGLIARNPALERGCRSERRRRHNPSRMRPSSVSMPPCRTGWRLPCRWGSVRA